MSKHKNLKRNLLICLLAGSAVMYTLPLHAATSVIANNTLPQNGQFFNGNEFIQGTANEKGNGFDFADIGSITKPNDLTMNVHQNEQNAVIKWDSFDVGGSATVNFKGPQVEGGYNTLNYVNAGGSMSQIYGTINANNNGNIFIVNPAGVQIGNSAQINVGSLYVSNKYLNEDKLAEFNGSNINSLIDTTKTANAELMSLGNINVANNVTFDGDRIVLDTDRVIFSDEENAALNIRTTDTNNVILGYEAYNETDKYKHTVDYEKYFDVTKVTIENGNIKEEGDSVKGYMWVEDVEQLQAINTNLGGNYALRNSIDATSTSAWNYNAGFNPIGLDENGKVIVNVNVNNNKEYGFTGNFDGIDYNIFGLTIDRSDEANVGLFGVAHNANINNITLVGGSITGGSVVGSVVGAALGNTHITNATNSASVTGNTDVGGIVGYSGKEINGLVNNITTNAHFTNLINTGAVHSNGESDEQGGIVSNAGGLIGYMYNGTLDGNSYNLGNVSGDGYNVGGLVGHAVNSTIGDGTNLVYNRLDVTGAYNVGGIVGNMEGSTVKYAENSGTVLATEYTEGEYIYHTDNVYFDETYGTFDDRLGSQEVNIANVGGIAGTSSNNSSIENVTNSGDISSNKQTNKDYYDAGNVGGIVGSAVDTNITNATNRENEVRGAHNVGGVAGYFGNSNDADSEPDYTITTGINDGGDIMATGARCGETYFGRELVRYGTSGGEENIIGNIGGVVGYLDGDNVYVTGSANRGNVHSLEITNTDNVSDASKAANTGGVVGKIDRNNTASLDELKNKNKKKKAAVSNSYNTGDVRGYMGVGGVVGMMYNGEVMSSYNLGTVNTTRKVSDVTGADLRLSVNMGGVVGDTTEQTSAHSVLYDVYNKGQIGDDTFTFYSRHVGGIVGRLSGYVDKAYNTGAIYNGYNVVGGIAGWFYKGGISNSFNTGNITVVNNNNEASSQVGGIVGAAGMYANVKEFNRDWQDWTENSYIKNVYNLGTIRSFDKQGKGNSVGGIIGYIAGDAPKDNTPLNIRISNVYTTGNLYAQDKDGKSDTTGLGSIIGLIADGADKRFFVENAYYIKPDDERSFTVLTGSNNNANKEAIEFADKSDIGQYQYNVGDKHYSLTFTQQEDGDVDGGGSVSVAGVDENGEPILNELANGQTGDWRIYDGNTPILNAFLPDSEKYFAKNGLTDNSNNTNNTNKPFNGSIQYGTAYDPLLTIINTDRDLVFNFGTEDNELSITNAAGLAVYGGGVTLNNFTTNSGSGYFGGTIYADGALNLNGGTNDIGLGSAADIYGSAVNITTGGKVTIYGDVTATGNGTTTENNPDIDGSITINAGDVDVYGKLTSATTADYGNDVKIPGIEGTAVTWNPGNVSDPYAEMSDIADRFAHTTGKSNVNGNITINAGKDKDGNAIGGGNVNIYFGNQEQGLITTGGDLTVTSTGDVYVDSDLDVGGNLRLTSTGKNSEILLTLTNIGKVQADKFTGVIENFLNGKNIADIDASDLLKVIQKAYPGVEFTDAYAKRIVDALTKYQESGNKASAIEQLNNDIAVAYMHHFMHNFDKTVEGSNKIYLNAASGDAKLTVDMWDYDQNTYNFGKYDTQFDDNGTFHTFKDELDNLDLHVNNDTAGVHAKASKYVYVEVSNGAQLKAIQQADADALAYNYALMGDINASGVSGYEAIGAGSDNGFTGTFDGRGNRIIGLDTTKDSSGSNTNSMTNAGIFSTVGAGGVVKDVNIYSGTFTGSKNAGTVAGKNNGRIEGIVTFGNTVTVTGEDGNASNAGGIVGVNNNGGTVDDVESTGSVIAGSSSAIAGGLVGTNNGGLANSFSDSAVTVGTNVTGGTSAGLGGVVGINNGNVQYVDSLGVTNGGATGSSNIGGIIGTNNGNMYSGYNESIVSGANNVGGIIGDNDGSYDDYTDTWTGGIVENVVNATGVTGTGDYVGGLVGTNIGSVENGRNNGTITGTNYVGGMVGSNADEHSILANLTNDSAADISGENYVGGIAGTNSGTITAQNQSNLINRGSITGQNYVGGVAGENIGTIEYVKNDVNLYVKDSNETAKYFGGVAGINGRVDDTATTEDETATGTITSATNEGDVVAENAQYVGGIVGWNTVNGKLDGMGNSNTGRVEGATYVGGVAGKNDADITGNVDNIVTIENSGVVIAHNGGAGGIFGENTGDITYAEMSNSGIVSGTNYSGSDDVTNGTGGIIGVNSGDITYSSITNTVDGQVTGINNVGGLIGYNTGTIIGGRNEAQETGEDGNVTAENDSYYKYQIYNNGTITVTGSGSNIGGLIGNNAKEIVNGAEQTGSLTAGYNTGAINASGSTNVGGIVGSNSGTLDQVFNTVMTADGKNQTITGGTNVGGLVGTNSGTLSNAYNTTAVEGSSNVGNAVGNNTTGTITNIYASNTSGKLIGNNINTAQDAIQNAYSFVKDDTSVTTVLDEKVAQKAEESYGFDNKDDGTTWKFYNGYSNPLLKVFLTKAEYTTGNKDFTYNATDQGLTINSNTITAADKLDAYNNANSLLTATQNKNAGEGYLGIYSQQIATSGKGDAFDPNNLGYDIDVTYDIKKKQLNITLDDVHRVYGNVAITQGGYQISNIDGWQGSDKDLANGITISPANDKDSFEQTDTALTGNNTGKVTENAGGQYTWSADVTLSEEIAQNYEITTTTLTGNSYVGKAKLTININDVTMTYGDKESTISNQYGYTVNNGLVNGDSLKDVIADMTYENTAYNTDGTTKDVIDGKYALQDKDVTGGSKYGNYEITINDGEVTMGKAQLVVDINNVDMTYGDKESTISNQYGYTVNNGLVNEDSLKDVIADMTYENTAYNADGTTKDVIDGKYALENKDITVGGKYGNYEVTINNGTVMMNKADLNIKVDNANTTVGKMPSELTGTVEGLTNGDTLPTHDFALKDDSFISVSGNHENVIGIVIGGKFYELGDADWSNGLFANYDINYEMGDLAVSVVEMPDNWPNNRWDYLFSDNPFDRNENFRERKAEVNFVDGAMEI